MEEWAVQLVLQDIGFMGAKLLRSQGSYSNIVQDKYNLKWPDLGTTLHPLVADLWNSNTVS